MQLTHVFLEKPMPAIGTGGQTPVKMFFVGMKCNDAYGGGVIKSLTYEKNSLVIRKDRPFVIKGDGVRPSVQFDHVDIPWGNIQYSYSLDDKAPVSASNGPNASTQQPQSQKAQPAPTEKPAQEPQDPPPAKPIPSQAKAK